MMKFIFCALTCAVSLPHFAQVGIGIGAPNATLDVVGSPTNTTKLDGIIAPRLTGSQLRAKNYGNSQDGAIVYVNQADSLPQGQTINVTSTGYYYFSFSNNRWIKMDDGKISKVNVSDLSPLFTTTVLNGSTTSISYDLSNASSNTYFGNASSISGLPSFNKASNLTAGTTSSTGALALPLEISGGNSQLLGTSGATLTINNDAPIWNAGKIYGRKVSNVAPTSGQVLQYNSVTNQYEPSTPSNDWKVSGNSNTTPTSSLGAVSVNYVGTSDDRNLVFGTGGTVKAILGTDGSLKGGGGTLNSISWGSLSGTAISSGSIGYLKSNIAIGATGYSSVALGSDNTADADSSVAIGYGNISNYGVSIGRFNYIEKASTNVNSFIIGASNSIPGGGGFALGINNHVQKGFALGGNNFVSANGFVVGHNSSSTGNDSYAFGSNAAASAGQNVYANANHMFYNKSNATTTKVGINVDSATSISADLTVKATIQMLPSASGTCNANLAGTIIYQEVSGVGSFTGCRKTSSGYEWKALTNL